MQAQHPNWMPDVAGQAFLQKILSTNMAASVTGEVPLGGGVGGIAMQQSKAVQQALAQSRASLSQSGFVAPMRPTAELLRPLQPYAEPVPAHAVLFPLLDNYYVMHRDRLDRQAVTTPPHPVTRPLLVRPFVCYDAD